jgi:hypothetical protein
MGETDRDSDQQVFGVVSSKERESMRHFKANPQFNVTALQTEQNDNKSRKPISALTSASHTTATKFTWLKTTDP